MRYGLLMIAFAAALSQSAVRANPIDIYTPEWQAKVSGTGYVNTGNIERVLLRGDAAFSYHNPLWAYSTTNSYIWGTYAGKQAENDWSSRNFGYLWPESVVYPFVMHWLETAYRRRIDIRNQVGAGATWAIYSAPTTILKLSLMLSGEATDYAAPSYLADGSLQSTDRPHPRATPRLYLRQSLGMENTFLAAELWYQQSLRQQIDYRWHGEVGIEYGIGKSLSLKTMLVYHYESATPTGVQRQDIAWTFGVSGKLSARESKS